MDAEPPQSTNTSPTSFEPTEPSSRSWFQRLTRFFRNAPADKQDLMDALSEAHEHKVLDQEAVDMIEGVMEVAELRVHDVMIPRAQMEVIEIEHTLEEIMAIVESSGHSRFPVINEDRDDVIGILLVKDLLPYIKDRSRTLPLAEIVRKPRFIPESKRLNTLLSDFRKTRQHMAVVVDEFGGIAGLITIEDVIEEIIGEIDDEHDEIEAPQIRRLPMLSSDADHTEHKRFWLDALYTIEELNEKFSLQISDEKADTVGGLVALTLGKVPNEGERVNIEGCTFIVLKTAKRRIESLELQL